MVLVVATAGMGVLLAFVNAPSTSAPHTLSLAATPSQPAGVWRDVGLSADEQIVFSRGAPQTAYSCGIAHNTIVMHVTHDGGMSWRSLTFFTPIAGDLCVLAVDDTNPQHLALMTRVTKPDPCLAAMCTPTPCADVCQTCIDYCPPPAQQTLTLYRSSDGGTTWQSSAPLPDGVHFTPEIAYVGATLYAWTDTWPALLASSVADGPFRLIDLSAYFPQPQSGSPSPPYQGATHLWPVRGQLYLPIPGGDVPGGDLGNHYILSGDGGQSWTSGTFTMDGDPVVLRPGSGLDGRTLMGERIHMTGFLVLSTDGGRTWQPSPAPYPDFSHYGLTQCYVAADGSFFWFNAFDANVGLGVFRAKAGATAWTKLLGAPQIQDISVDLASYDAAGHLVALWGRQSRAAWVVYRLG
jgi:hypothetical protein